MDISGCDSPPCLSLRFEVFKNICIVSDQFEFVGMRPHVLTFEKKSSPFNEMVDRVGIDMNVGCDLRLHGRYDMGGNRPMYVMLPLGSEENGSCIRHVLGACNTRFLQE
jgi:hypothetical protein